MPASPQDTVELALAAGPPGGDVIAISEEHSAANLRWAGNTLTTNGVTTSRSLKVIALDRRADGTCGVGAVTRSAVDRAQVEDIVREAVRIASDAPAAEDAGELPSGAAPGSAAWDDPPAGTEVGVLRRFAAELGATLRAAAGAERTLYGFAEHQVTSTFLGTSAGLRMRHDQPTGRLELNAKSPDLTRSAWAGATTRDFSDVDIASLDASLARRLSWQSRQVELPAGRYETLLPPAAVADLMVHLYWSAGMRAAAEGRTVFGRPGGGTRIGEQLAAQPVTLFSDPAHPGLECRPFVVGHASEPDSSVFDNGLPAGRVPWISVGVLSALRSSRYSAGLAGLPVTPAVDNLVLTGDGDALPSLEAMIASTKRGLLLTCLWYIRKVDPRTLLLTGLTRDGVYLVENGEVVGAVNNFRFNESPVGMLGRLLEVGTTEDRTLPREWSDDFTRCAMPPLRVEGFTMSSVSQAR
ncbi:metallopeptidase TldD-related protein [Actinophytocola glycyrrhizae]|uniref:Metallopeptidase TldD-related protein n=1 Tax=Actinophytocola glycyrrhizae TaxID=2044873 RepID=A0ABV9RXD0_9PSEU